MYNENVSKAFSDYLVFDGVGWGLFIKIWIFLARFSYPNAIDLLYTFGNLF